MAVWHGCAMVNSQYPDRTGTGDKFEYSVDLIVGLGFSTTMSYANSGFDQDYDGEDMGTPLPTTLAELFQTPMYEYLFNSSGLNRHVFQVWTFANGTESDPPATQLTTTQLQNEYTEIYNACVHLLSTYSGKEFIIKNWEGDWQLLNGFNPNLNVPSMRAQRYAAFANVRQRAVRDARRDTPSTSTIKYMVEVNRCLDDHGYRLHRDVLQLVQPDMVGWSCYEAINYWTVGWEREPIDAQVSNEEITTLAYGNGVYVVGAKAGKIASSTDGRTWVSRTSTFGSSDINSIVWLTYDQKFLAVGEDGKIAYSSDGATWTSVTSPVITGLNGIFQDGGGFNYIYGDATVILYTVGITGWQQVGFIGGAPAGSPDFLAADFDDVESFNFVVAGTGGKAVYGSGPVAISVNTQFSTSTIRKVLACKNGTGRFILAGDDGKISTSSYGGPAPYTLQTSQFSTDAILGLTKGGSTIVAVGTNGKISTSTDNGSTWTARTAGTGAYLRTVTYSSTEQVFAYGCDGAIGYSKDGVNWTVNGQAALTGEIVYHMLSTADLTITGSPNGRMTIAPFWHCSKAAESNIDRFIRKGVKRIKEFVDPDTPIVLSEYGFPQQQSNFTGLGLDIAAMIQQVIDTANAIGIYGVIWWQILDNEEQSPGVPRGFCLYDRDGSSTTAGPLNAAGLKYQSIL
jgi:photosystem II stability/assembly factor-like uncharacterized protein